MRIQARLTRQLLALVTLISCIPVFSPQTTSAQVDCSAAVVRAVNWPNDFSRTTGKTVDQIFFDYWSANGGASYFGLPQSDALTETDAATGQQYMVQYFDYDVFRRPLTATTTTEITLDPVGVLTYTVAYPTGAPDQMPNMSCYFPDTGKWLGGSFLEYWRKRGGQEQLGMPISDEFSEVSTDPYGATTLTVQYFERAVLEWHPEYQLSCTAYRACYKVIRRPLAAQRYSQLYKAPILDSWPQARDYLVAAFDFISTTALKKAALQEPWDDIVRRGLDLPVEVPTDTYDFLDDLVNKKLQMVDHHSFFTPRGLAPTTLRRRSNATGGPISDGLGFTFSSIYPQPVIDTVDAGSEAEQQGLMHDDVLVAIDNITTSTMDSEELFRALYNAGAKQVVLSFEHPTSRQVLNATINHKAYEEYYWPKAWRLPARLGYAAMPGADSTDLLKPEYASDLQQALESVDHRQPTCGWIVDLRHNDGGDATPMLLGIGPVLGEDIVGGFQKEKDRDAGIWQYSSNMDTAGTRTATIQLGASLTTLANAKVISTTNPPVAVLTSGTTASSGELIAVAFRGRDQTALFGDPTHGQTLNNKDMTLADGALLTIANSWYADRNGTRFEGPIQPDYPVTDTGYHSFCDQNGLCTDNMDSGVYAATNWLLQEPGCLP